MLRWTDPAGWPAAGKTCADKAPADAEDDDDVRAHLLLSASALAPHTHLPSCQRSACPRPLSCCLAKPQDGDEEAGDEEAADEEAGDEQYEVRPALAFCRGCGANHRSAPGAPDALLACFVREHAHAFLRVGPHSSS